MLSEARPGHLPGLRVWGFFATGTEATLKAFPQPVTRAWRGWCSCLERHRERDRHRHRDPLPSAGARHSRTGDGGGGRHKARPRLRAAPSGPGSLQRGAHLRRSTETALNTSSRLSTAQSPSRMRAPGPPSMAAARAGPVPAHAPERPRMRAEAAREAGALRAAMAGPAPGLLRAFPRPWGRGEERRRLP